MTRMILETVQPMNIIKPEQTDRSSIINEALQSNDESLYRCGNNPPSMFYEDVVDSRIKSLLRQSQLLEERGKHLYKYQPIRSKKKRYTCTKNILHQIFCCSSHSNFGIGDLVVGATTVTIFFLFIA